MGLQSEKILTDAGQKQKIYDSILRLAHDLKALLQKQTVTQQSVSNPATINGQNIFSGGNIVISTTLGTPADGGYGSGQGAGSMTGVANGDSLESAFDKVETFLELIAPEPPPNLSAVVISIGTVFIALEQNTGTLRVNITESTQPTGVTQSAFADAKTGTLTAEIDTANSGQITFTTGDNTNLENGAVKILLETILNNIYQQCTAQIKSTVALSLSNVLHTYKLIHSKTGFSQIQFYIDDPATPILSNHTAVGVVGVAKYISGVPTLATNDDIKNSFNISSAVSWFFHQTQIARVESIHAQSGNVPLPAISPNRGAVVSVTDFITKVLANVYTEGAALTHKGYNAKGTESLFILNTNIRIDTKSNDGIRLKSGQGQFPTKGSLAGQFGDAFNSSESLATSGNEELMLINTEFKYPSGNFISNLPTPGPDYTTVPSGTFNNMRWVTMNVGSISNATFVLLNLIGTTNFTGTPIESGVEFYLLVDGAAPTGWLNINAAYSGVGSPANNGDAALDVSSSTATTKRITFGTVVRTGTVYVRLGIPVGSTKKIQSITKS